MVWALCTSKRRELYVLILRLLVTTAQEVTGRVPRPRFGMADFELSILYALHDVFEDIRVSGCWSHSGRVKQFNINSD